MSNSQEEETYSVPSLSGVEELIADRGDEKQGET